MWILFWVVISSSGVTSNSATYYRNVDCETAGKAVVDKFNAFGRNVYYVCTKKES